MACGASVVSRATVKVPAVMSAESSTVGSTVSGCTSERGGVVKTQPASDATNARAHAPIAVRARPRSKRLL